MTCHKLIWFFLALILLIIIILWALNVDRESQNFDYENLDNCGNPQTENITPLPKTKEIKNNKVVLDKFVQAENEIDTLCRSYVIESLCSCQEALTTFQRIEYLCDRAGEYLSSSYGRAYGTKYAVLRKSSCQEFKKCVDSREINNHKWSQDEEKIADHVATYNKCMSREFLARTRQDHCRLLCRLIDDHLERKSLEAMVTYDALKEKTDSYLEHITSSIYQC